MLPPMIQSTFNYAAFGGHIKVLVYLFNEHGYLPSNTYKYAIKSEKMETLEWILDAMMVPNVKYMATAAKLGKFEIVKWLHKNGYPWAFAYDKISRCTIKEIQ
jgi:secreted Zn-dependent insulinase-like peptidase